MNLRQVYQWRDEIRTRLQLGKWQALGLAIFSIGIVLSERSTLSKIAEKLWFVGRTDSIERRLQRWLANPRIDIETCSRQWVKWVIASMTDRQQIVLLVDLTKLGEHLDVMMVGLAYRKRCIPLAWQCMAGNQTWPDSQVNIIGKLLSWISAGIPAGHIPLVQADRGIGTSPALVDLIDGMGWHYLLRITKGTHMLTPDGRDQAFKDRLRRGIRWSGKAKVFKTAGGRAVTVHLIWRRSQSQAWCLITNCDSISGSLYAWRVWQEEAFKDLKSGGWQWQRSMVRSPEHAARLILVLALAYAWMLSLGTQAIRAGKTLRRRLVRGRRRRLSAFRLGLRYLHELFRIRQPPLMILFFHPSLT